MSKYSVTITNDDGTVENLLFDNYKQVSEKTGLSIGTITRMMNGVIKYHKKGTKDKLLKIKIKKLGKISNDDLNNEKDVVSKEIIDSESSKINNCFFSKNLSMNVLKLNIHNTTKNNNQISKYLNLKLYSLFTNDLNASFSEKIMCASEKEGNDLENDLINEIKRNICADTLCIVICNKNGLENR